ncbi:MAG: DUF523 and DUF1722 domain-containing protein, partial [Caldimicrobium sp.]
MKPYINEKNISKPRIVLSKCFLKAVRYDGGRVYDDFVDKLINFVEVIEVCPEVGMGLTVPRERLIIKLEGNSKRLFQPDTGKDFTEAIQKFSQEFLKMLSEIDGFLLKAKSPSCGVSSTKLYKEDKVIKKTSGFFAAFAKKAYPYLPIEDELGLKDTLKRWHFLIRIFAFSKLRNMLKRQDSKALEEFHTEYKYLLLTFNQKQTKELEKLVKRRDLSLEEKNSLYGVKFYKAFLRKPSSKNFIKALRFFHSSFFKKLKQKEIEQLQEVIKRFEEERLPLKVLFEELRKIVYSWESSS